MADPLGSEVAPGIHRIAAPLGERIVCLYLLIGETACLLVDTGVDASLREALLPYLNRIGLAPERIRYCVVTHADVDHMGGDAALRELLPTIVVLAHELDRGLIEDVDRIVRERYSEFAAGHGIDVDDGFKAWCGEAARAAPVDVVVRGGECIRLGPDRLVELLHTPGHSWGSLSVFDPQTRSAIVGDAVLGEAVLLADGRPAFPPTYRYVAAYRATIDRLEGLAPELLLTSHYPVYRGAEAAAFFAASWAFADRVEEAAIAELRAAGAAQTTRELVETLSPRLGRWPPESAIFLANALVGHLEWLASVGRVSMERRDDLIVWRWTG